MSAARTLLETVRKQKTASLRRFFQGFTGQYLAANASKVKISYLAD
jgi:hypothetical protein